MLITLRVRYNRVSQDSDHQATFGVGVGAGLNVPASDSLSLMPAVTVMRLNTKTKDGGSPEVSFTRLMATFSGHLLYHPTAHLFLGLGPALSTSLRSDVDGVEGLSMTVVGADGMIGAWW